MTLETIYYISQTVAVIVIIATLFAVLFQMRQANRLARLETSRAVWMDASARIYSHVEDAEGAEFFHRALYETGDLTDAEKTRFYLLMSSLFTMFENFYAMHLSGMMEDRLSLRMRTSVRDYLASPRAQRWWSIARERTFGSNPEFTAEIDGILAEISGKDQ